jgi:hypothetical protein
MSYWQVLDAQTMALHANGILYWRSEYDEKGNMHAVHADGGPYLRVGTVVDIMNRKYQLAGVKLAESTPGEARNTYNLTVVFHMKAVHE